MKRQDIAHCTVIHPQPALLTRFRGRKAKLCVGSRERGGLEIQIGVMKDRWLDGYSGRKREHNGEGG